MSNNAFDVKRTAFAHVTLAGSATAISTQTGAYLPAGAIVTGMRVVATAATSLASVSAATFTPYVSTLALASNNINGTDVLSSGVPKVVALSATDGIRIPTGAYLDIDLGAGNAGGYNVEADIYVDYIYCDERNI